MDFPLISIVIPVYNTAKFLDKCISSAIAQKYPNLEIVILNNGSTDNSQEIINKYNFKDKRIKSFAIDHVPTVKESKDNCYRRASGDWVITLDSDDAIDSNYVDKIWEAHLRTGADMIIAQRISVDEDGNEYDQLPTDDFDFSSCFSGKEALKRTVSKWELSVNGALVSKSNLYNIMLQNPKVKIYSDEYDSRVLLLNANKVSLCKANYYYTFNRNSVGKKNNWNRHRFRINTRLGLLDLCDSEFGIYSKEYRNAVTQALGVALIAIRHYFNHKHEYTDNNQSELHELVKKIYCSSKIYGFSFRTAFNASAKILLNIVSSKI